MKDSVTFTGLPQMLPYGRIHVLYDRGPWHWMGWTHRVRQHGHWAWPDKWQLHRLLPILILHAPDFGVGQEVTDKLPLISSIYIRTYPTCMQPYREVEYIIVSNMCDNFSPHKQCHILSRSIVLGVYKNKFSFH